MIQGISLDPAHQARIVDFFGRDLAAMSSSNRDLWIERAVHYWRNRGFPYPEAGDPVFASELSSLQRVCAEDLHRVLQQPSMIGLRIANSFHPEMWAAKVRGLSPIECFADDRTLRRAVRRAIVYWPNRRCWGPSRIRLLIGLHNRARVSNFRPTVARALAAAFSRDGGRVLDFCAGFSGRLLGVLTLSRHYVGIDSGRAQHSGSTKLLTALADRVPGTAELHLARAEAFLPAMQGGTFDLVLSSPPYFKLERYPGDETQSFRRYGTYSEWRNGFLRVLIQQAYRLLRSGGRLVLNVADVASWPVASDSLHLARPLFGDPQHVLEMFMSTNPADKHRRRMKLRSEPIFVFAK